VIFILIEHYLFLNFPFIHPCLSRQNDGKGVGSSRQSLSEGGTCLVKSGKNYSPLACLVKMTEKE